MAYTAPKQPIKILMCHGFTQSGPLFHAKTRALEKTLNKAFPAGVTLVYPTGPHKIMPADAPQVLGSTGVDAGSEDKTKAAVEVARSDAQTVYGWWVRRGTSEPIVYDGMEEGLARVAQTLKEEGPFDGVIGFSQGGGLAGMVASLLEPGRKAAFDKLEGGGGGGMAWPASFDAAAADSGASNGCVHPPLKFAVIYSGFAARPNPLYRAFYEPKIKTPLLHFLGQLDTVVEESRSLLLIEACEGGADGMGGMDGKRVVRHPGGHFLPASQKEYVNALIMFIQEVLGGQSSTAVAKEEEKAEDMDMPF